MTKICKNCKHQNLDVHHYCVKCGKPLETGVAFLPKKYVVISEEEYKHLKGQKAAYENLQRSHKNLQNNYKTLQNNYNNLRNRTNNSWGAKIKRALSNSLSNFWEGGIMFLVIHGLLIVLFGWGIFALVKSCLSNSNDNYFMKIVQDENTHKYGLFNENDKQQVLACDYDTIIHNRASYFNFFYIRKNNLWGVTDSLGQVTVDCSLDSVRTSSNRVDFVLISYAGNKRGVLDNHGYVILPCEFTHVLWKYDMRDHIASMDQPGNYVGNIVPAVKNENGRWELYNRKGERINQSLYIDVQQTCHPDLVKVKDKSLSGYGLIDINGNEILPCKYNVIYNFCNDRTWIRVGRARKSLNDDLADDKWMCIDSQGKVAFSYPGNYTVYPFSQGLAAVINNDVTKIDNNSLVGFCDVNGNMVIPMVYNPKMTEAGGWYHPTFTDEVEPRAWVSYQGKDGYLTTDGTFHED